MLSVFIFFYLFVVQEIVKNMGKLSDDSKWLNEYFTKLLQKSFHPSKEHKQESSTGLSPNSLVLQPIRNKGTDESTFFTNDDSNPMKKHSSWVNKTQGLVNEDLSNGDMTGCQQGHEVHNKNKHRKCFKSLYFIFTKISLILRYHSIRTDVVNC